MGRPLKIKKTSSVDIGFNGVATLTSPVVPETLSGTEYLGVVGGNNGSGESVSYPIIKCRVRIAGESEADGYIIRQKGSRAYLVSDGSNTGVCILADEADGALTEGNMNITFTLGDSTAVNIARLTNRYALDYSNNRYLVNFFTDEGTQIKSGTAGTTLEIGIVENYTS
jgi:hypothetical protein